MNQKGEWEGFKSSFLILVYIMFKFLVCFIYLALIITKVPIPFSLNVYDQLLCFNSLKGFW